jgi:hypothetical protein
MPHTTKPTAKAHTCGAAVQMTKATAWRTPARTTTPRRDHRSASTPEGTSVTNPVTDQIAKSAEICAFERPVSRKSSA